jgi:AcrR family transcriptional regulator
VTTGRREPDAVAVRRRYRSPLREQQTEQTKHAVVQAAHDLFVANGWAATGMREVAATAGVALETVYSLVSSKRGLLRAVTVAAVVDDDEAVSPEVYVLLVEESAWAPEQYEAWIAATLQRVIPHS